MHGQEGVLCGPSLPARVHVRRVLGAVGPHEPWHLSRVQGGRRLGLKGGILDNRPFPVVNLFCQH